MIQWKSYDCDLKFRHFDLQNFTAGFFNIIQCKIVPDFFYFKQMNVGDMEMISRFTRIS